MSNVQKRRFKKPFSILPWYKHFKHGRTSLHWDTIHLSKIALVFLKFTTIYSEWTKKHLGLLISSSSTSDFELKVQRVFWTTAPVWLFPKHCLGLSRLRLKVDSENSCWAVGQNQKRDLCHSLHFVGFYTSNMFRFRLPHNWRLWDRGDLWSKRGWFNTSCTNDSLTIHLLLGSRGC